MSINDEGKREVEERPVTRRATISRAIVPAALLLLGGCASALKVGQRKPAVEIPDKRGGYAFRPDGTRVFRNHRLVDQDGKAVYFQDDLVEGQVFAATFQYAKCTGICKNMTEKMKLAADILGGTMNNPVRFYMFSLAEDSPADMKEYMQARGIYGRPGWRFLSGSREAITDIRWAFGFGEPNEELDQTLSAHTGMVRYCHHATDKWAACPALGEPSSIARLMVRCFPNDQRPSIPALNDGLFENGTPIPGYKPLPAVEARRSI